MALFGKKNEREIQEKMTAPVDMVTDNDKRAGGMAGDKIGEKEVIEASQILAKYKEGKTNLERRIIENEQWWKRRHWAYVQNKTNVKEDNETHSAWLFNCIMSKYADYMDAYPEPNILPREESDKQEAKMLSSIVPVVLEQNGFEGTYSDEAWYKLKTGAGVYGCFWDASANNGLGEISIKQIDLLNLFWEPGVKNIQDSANVFHVNLVDNKILEQRYPQTKGKLVNQSKITAEYLYDDNVDTSGKSAVVDWYYHTEYNGKKVLHYCKYVNNVVLYATENDTEMPTQEVSKPMIDIETGKPIMDENGKPMMVTGSEPTGDAPMSERGWYDHALYPFVVDTMFAIEGSICGFSYIDVCKDPQKYIDKLKQALLDNALNNATPRFFFRADGQINEEEYLDTTKKLVKFQGNLSDDNVREIPQHHLDGMFINLLQHEINEMKETTGNTDVSQGVVGGGVTSGSAISALQESAGKTSRSQNKGAYRAYSQLITMVIELIRQFYDTPRQFRITGEYGQEEFVSYSNKNMQPQSQSNDFGIDMGYRLPVFDVKVSAQKQNPYTKNSQNEMALQFFQMGFFNPEMADQALACLDAMDFSEKDGIQQKIQKNSMLLQENMALKQKLIEVSSMVNPEMGRQFAMAFDAEGGQPQAKGRGSKIKSDYESEHPFNERAREMAQGATQVD